MPTRCAKQILRVLTVLACAYFALWACAPPSVVAPLVPFDPDNPTTLGGSLVASADYYPHVGAQPNISLGGGASLWVEQHKPNIDLIVVAAVTQGSWLSGAGLRWRAVTTDRVLLGLQGELGLLWTSLSVPLSFRVRGDSWLYTAPQAIILSKPQYHFPLGVSILVTERTRVHVEAGWQPLIDLDRIDDRLPFYVAAGLTWRPAWPSGTSPASP